MKNRMDYVVEAKEEEPEGAICVHCGGVNNFADDCGWFYYVGTETTGATCKKCAGGDVGQNHRQLYGVGER